MELINGNIYSNKNYI